MCPLRLILIFLSATLAGYFAWKSIWNQDVTGLDDQDAGTTAAATAASEDGKKTEASRNPASHCVDYKVWSILASGLWTFVDMASGKYLWRNLGAKKMD